MNHILSPVGAARAANAVIDINNVLLGGADFDNFG